MTDAEMPRNPVEELAEEFLERYRRGERPPLTEFTERRPDLASAILRLFPTLAMLEELDPHSVGKAARGSAAVTGDGRALEQIGEYRIVRELGRGGMGVVYEAAHAALGRQVALKVLPLQAAKDETRLKRFWREARAVARLHHSNIVPVFEVGEYQGIHFYAMQLIHGQALDALLSGLRRADQGPGKPERRPPTEETLTLDSPAEMPSQTWDVSTGTPLSGSSHHYRQVARLGLQVAEALAYAHEHKILHRDIKPANLLIDQEGTVWVTDFGLAKDEGDTLTRTGDVVGTLRYMAPERFNGAADGRSDVYSLGLTLYEYLILRPAFDESDRGRLIRRIAREEPPRPRQLDRHVPRDLETIILKASAKEPGQRYSTAAMMADDLRRFLADRPIRARRASVLEQAWRWGRRNPVVAGMTAGMAALLALVAVITSVAAVRLGHEQNATLAQLHLTQDAERESKRQLYRALIVQAQASRSGGQLGQQFKTLEALQKAAVLAPDLDLASDARLARRNALISALVVSDLRVAKQLEGSLSPKGAVRFDARLEHYARSDDEGNVSVRRVADDRELVRLPGPGYGVGSLRFSPDGRFLAAKYYKGFKDWAQEYRVWEWRHCRRVVYHASNLLNEDQCFSADSRQVLLGGRSDGILTFYELPSGRVAHKVALGYWPGDLAMDPSGKRFAVCRAPTEVEVRDVDTGQLSCAPFGGHTGFSTPAWRDDGRLLAAADEDGHIHVWDVEKHRQQALLTGHTQPISEIIFSHAGDLLASSSWDGTTRLWEPMSGRQLLSAPAVISLQFSTDDTQLAHVHFTQPAIWQLARGWTCRRLFAHEPSRYGPWCVHFSPDGRLLASGSYDGVRFWDTRAGQPLGHLPIGCVYSTFFQADGSCLLTSGAAGLLRWPVHALRGGHGDAYLIGPPHFLRTAPFERVAWDQKGPRVALAQRWGPAFLLDLDRPAENAHVCKHVGLSTCEMSADGKWLATGNFKGHDVRIWDTADGRLVRKLAIPASAGAAFSPDSRTLITAVGNDYRFWAVGSWKPGPLIQTEEMGGGGGTVAFSPDGRLLALIHASRAIKLFDAKTRQELATLAAPDSQPISALCWSPDGSQLAASTLGQTIQLWDIRGLRRRLAGLDLDWDPRLGRPLAGATHRGPIRVIVELGGATSQRRLAEARDPDFPLHLLDVIVALRPWNGQAYLQRASAHTQRNQMEQAEADYEVSAVLLSPSDPAFRQPEHARLYNSLAWRWTTAAPARRQLTRALSLARQAVALAPGQRFYWNTLGVVCYRIGRYSEAVAALQRSLGHGHGKAAPFDLFFLAMCHHHMGQPARARACYDQAMRWLQAHEKSLPADWAAELPSFRAEAAALLQIPDAAPGAGDAAP